MAKRNGISYEEFTQLAKANYEKGGDVFYECWDERVFNNYVTNFGVITKTEAKRMFRDMLDTERDRAGYGW